jgi:DNA-3-methyladenine glycosylase II
MGRKGRLMSSSLSGKRRGGKSGARPATAKTKAKAKPASKAKPVSKTKKAPKAAPRKIAPRKRIKRRLARTPKAAILYHPGPLLDSETALAEAAARLLALDPDTIGKLAEAGGATPLRRQEPGFAGLARIIISQQVSTASANAIFARTESLLAPLSAESVLAASDETLRACGLSAPKMRALRALAQAVATEGLDLTGLGALVAEDAHRALVAVKGVGPWTADIFLLFCLGHPDAFPAGDLALQEAAKLALGLKQRPDARRLEEIAERWRPLRGVAARMLWAYYRVARKRVGMALEISTT